MSQAHSSSRTYLIIWGWLAGLMLVSVGLSELPLAKSTIVSLVLFLSTVKALLVALYYMHLRWEPRRLWILVVAPLPLVVILIVAVLTEF